MPRLLICEMRGEYFPQRRKAKMPEQPVQPLLGLVQIQIVPETGLHRRPVNSRLFGIELPRVQIDHRRLVLAVDAADGVAGQRKWKQAKITPAGYGPIPPGIAHRTDGKLAELRPDPIGKARASGMPYRS